MNGLGWYLIGLTTLPIALLLWVIGSFAAVYLFPGGWTKTRTEDGWTATKKRGGLTLTRTYTKRRKQ